MSTELREEYEDLLRYAVVVPTSVDATKMAGCVGGGVGPLNAAATMVSRTTMVSSAPSSRHQQRQYHPASEHLSGATARSSFHLQPHPSPLNPEGDEVM